MRAMAVRHDKPSSTAECRHWQSSESEKNETANKKYSSTSYVDCFNSESDFWNETAWFYSCTQLITNNLEKRSIKVTKKP